MDISTDMMASFSKTAELGRDNMGCKTAMNGYCCAMIMNNDKHFFSFSGGNVYEITRIFLPVLDSAKRM